jgi:hypothetical protein
VLLTNYWLLTARHCVIDQQGVRAPESTVLVQGEGQSAGAYWINPHPTLDVALVYLNTPWRTSWSGRRPIYPYATSSLLWSPTYCAGWGDNLINPGGNAGAGQLRQFASFISATSPTSITVPNVYGQIQLNGDSGGGCFDSYGRLEGIASYIDNPAQPTYASLVSVEAFRSWLDTWVGP